MFRTQGEFPESLRILVRPGHHILIDAGVTVRNLIAQQFSRTGLACVESNELSCSHLIVFIDQSLFLQISVLITSNVDYIPTVHNIIRSTYCVFTLGSKL